MRRNPQIIHLYDKPHSRRSYSRTFPPSTSVGAKVLACAAIAGGVAAFFWAYDTVAHRGPPFVPALAHEITLGPRSAGAATKLIPLEVPAPDLHSPAVLLANADVPAPPATPPPAAATKEPDAAPPQKPKKAAAPPRKKRVQAAKRLPPAAANSYASEPGFFRGSHGGF